MARKLFSPSAFGVGDTVVWRHVTTEGSSIERIGTVVCEAPNVKGSTARWVMPDEPQPGDLYSMVVVVKVGRRTGLRPTALWGVPSASHGEFVSWDHWATDTGSMAEAAASHGERVKQTAAEAFLDEHVIVIPVGFAA